MTTARRLGLIVAALCIVALAGVEAPSPAQIKGGIPPPVRPVPPGVMVMQPKGGFVEEKKAEELTDAVTFPTDSEARRLIKAAQDYVKLERWQVATECLQGLLESKEDSFVEVKRKGPDGKEVTSRVSVRAEVNRMIGELPPAGREFYQVRYGQSAEDKLKEGLEKNDPQILAEVANRFLHTKAGGEATGYLGSYYLDRGSYLMAALFFEKLLARTENEQPPAKVLFRAALAFQRAGEIASAEKYWRLLADAAPREGVELGGRRFTLDSLRRELMREQGARAAVRSDWPLFRGNPSRTAQGIGGTPFLEAKWPADAPDTSMLPPLEQPDPGSNWIKNKRDDAISEMEKQGRPVLPAFFPVAANGKLIFRTYGGVSAVCTRDDQTQGL